MCAPRTEGAIYPHNAALKRYEAVGVQWAIITIMDAADTEPVRLFAETVLPASAGWAHAARRRAATG